MTDAEYEPMWEKLLRFTGSKETAQNLMTDIGLGKRIASIVAKRMVLLAESGQRPTPAANP
jgi:guanosine-3',5'-bis(diphosphate) 3'-pyrophosphohydrolase